MFDDVRERFRDDEVGGELDRIGQTSSSRAVHRHRQRCSSRERFHGCLETLVPEQRRVDSPCQLAELDERILDVVLCAGEDIRCGRIGASRFEAERDGKGHEALLRSVVEVSFDPAPLGVGSGDDPAARRTHFCELSTHLGR